MVKTFYLGLYHYLKLVGSHSRPQRRKQLNVGKYSIIYQSHGSYAICVFPRFPDIFGKAEDVVWPQSYSESWGDPFVDFVWKLRGKTGVNKKNESNNQMWNFPQKTWSIGNDETSIYVEIWNEGVGIAIKLLIFIATHCSHMAHGDYKVQGNR